MGKIFHRCAALCMAALFLTASGCVDAGKPEEGTDAPTESSAPDYSMEVVSGLARRDYLEPLEEFSWERQFPAEKVMLHFSSAVVLAPEDPYNMATIRQIFIDGGISVHYIIDRDGAISCWIPENRVAWHAGAGTYANDPRFTDQMNQYAIGIEIAAMGTQDEMAQYLTAAEYSALDPELIGFTDAQYESLAALVRDICTRNQIPMDREHIIGHSEYSESKVNPGALFDWSRIL